MRTPRIELNRHRAGRAQGASAGGVEAALRDAAELHAGRVRRLRANLVAWAVGSALLTALWVTSQWRANGALERFGHEGEDGQWNPTLWALGVGTWSMVVGIMALRVRLDRPVTAAEVDPEARRLTAAGAGGGGDASRLRALRRLERLRRVRFHVAAWALGMVIVTPLWALIEWQDNGAFERFSGDSEPGSWEPWFLYVGGIWAGAIALIALSLRVRERLPPRGPG
ncbi:hypothetical protein [Miltoncostaea marina]|uniref:hypothetical protein n=1 Tax=Miltoncostaea marina TaxID=2843215 RepID=UPI001C3E7965|nr:hypothetical protein [Miltoncostaea marina]